MKANIVGYDWETSYLAEDPNGARTKQVLADLERHISLKKIRVGEIIIINVADHSIAVETFEVMVIFKRSGIVKLEYRGGAS